VCDAYSTRKADHSAGLIRTSTSVKLWVASCTAICTCITKTQVLQQYNEQVILWHTVTRVIYMKTILDPEPSVSAGLPPTSTSPATSEPALETPDESEKERLSSVDTVLRRHFVRTPTPVVTDQHATATPPSSLRKRSGAKIKEWFGSVSKRRATRSTSPIHPALSHKASSASFS